MEEIILKKSKKTDFILMVTSIVFLLAGIMCLLMVLLKKNEDVLVLSFICFGYFLFITIYIFYDKPLLVINEKGIRASNIGMVLFPWSEIENAKITSILGIKTIRLSLKDSKSFREKMPFSIRFILFFVRLALFPEFMLNVSGLEYTPEQILLIIQENMNKEQIST